MSKTVYNFPIAGEFRQGADGIMRIWDGCNWQELSYPHKIVSNWLHELVAADISAIDCEVEALDFVQYLQNQGWYFTMTVPEQVKN